MLDSQIIYTSGNNIVVVVFVGIEGTRSWVSDGWLDTAIGRCMI